MSNSKKITKQQPFSSKSANQRQLETNPNPELIAESLKTIQAQIGKTEKAILDTGENLLHGFAKSALEPLNFVCSLLDDEAKQILVMGGMDKVASKSGYEGFSQSKAAEWAARVIKTVKPGEFDLFSVNMADYENTAVAVEALKESAKRLVGLDFKKDSSSYAKEIKEKLLKLDKDTGESYCMAGGWTGTPHGHAMVYRFKRRANGHFDIYIYNAQAGSENIQGGELSEGQIKVSPCCFFEDVNYQELFFSKENDQASAEDEKNSSAATLKYLIDLHCLAKKNHSLEEVFSICSRFTGKLATTKRATEPSPGYYISVQTSGNCAFKSINCLLLEIMTREDNKSIKDYRKLMLSSQFLLLLAFYKKYDFSEPKNLQPGYMLERALIYYLTRLDKDLKKENISLEEHNNAFAVCHYLLSDLHKKKLAIYEKIKVKEKVDSKIDSNVIAEQGKQHKQKMENLLASVKLPVPTGCLNKTNFSLNTDLGNISSWGELSEVLSELKTILNAASASSHYQSVISQFEITISRLFSKRNELITDTTTQPSSSDQDELYECLGIYMHSVKMLTGYASLRVQNAGMASMALSYLLAVKQDPEVGKYGLCIDDFKGMAAGTKIFSPRDRAALAQYNELLKFYNDINKQGNLLFDFKNAKITREGITTNEIPEIKLYTNAIVTQKIKDKQEQEEDEQALKNFQTQEKAQQNQVPKLYQNRPKKIVTLTSQDRKKEINTHNQIQQLLTGGQAQIIKQRLADKKLSEERDTKIKEHILDQKVQKYLTSGNLVNLTDEEKYKAALFLSISDKYPSNIHHIGCLKRIALSAINLFYNGTEVSSKDYSLPPTLDCSKVQYYCNGDSYGLKVVYNNTQINKEFDGDYHVHLKEYRENKQHNHTFEEINRENSVLINTKSNADINEIDAILSEPRVQTTLLIKLIEDNISELVVDKSQADSKALAKNDMSLANIEALFFKTYKDKDGYIFSPAYEQIELDDTLINKMDHLTNIYYKKCVEQTTDPKWKAILCILRLRASLLLAKRKAHPETKLDDSSKECNKTMLTWLESEQEKIAQQIYELKESDNESNNGRAELEKELYELQIAHCGLLLGIAPEDLTVTQRAKLLNTMVKINARTDAFSNPECLAFLRECQHGFVACQEEWQDFLKIPDNCTNFCQALMNERGILDAPKEWRLEDGNKLHGEGGWEIDFTIPMLTCKGSVLEDVVICEKTPAFVRLFGQKHFNVTRIGKERITFENSKWGTVDFVGTGEKSQIYRYINISTDSAKPEYGKFLYIHSDNSSDTSVKKALQMNNTLFWDHALWMRVPKDENEIVDPELRIYDLHSGEYLFKNTIEGQLVNVEGPARVFCLPDQAHSQALAHFDDLEQIEVWANDKQGDLDYLEFSRYVQDSSAQEPLPLQFKWDKEKTAWIYTKDPSYQLGEESFVPLCGMNTRHLNLVKISDKSKHKILIPVGKLSSKGFEQSSGIETKAGAQDGNKLSQTYYEYEYDDADIKQEMLPSSLALEANIYLAHIYLAQKQYQKAREVLARISMSNDRHLSRNVIKSACNLLKFERESSDYTPNACAIRLHAYSIFDNLNSCNEDFRLLYLVGQHEWRTIWHVYTAYLQNINDVEQPLLLEEAEELQLLKSLDLQRLKPDPKWSDLNISDTELERFKLRRIELENKQNNKPDAPSKTEFTWVRSGAGADAKIESLDVVGCANKCSFHLDTNDNFDDYSTFKALYDEVRTAEPMKLAEMTYRLFMEENSLSPSCKDGTRRFLIYVAGHQNDFKNVTMPPEENEAFKKWRNEIITEKISNHTFDKDFALPVQIKAIQPKEEQILIKKDLTPSQNILSDINDESWTQQDPVIINNTTDYNFKQWQDTFLTKLPHLEYTPKALKVNAVEGQNELKQSYQEVCQVLRQQCTEDCEFAEHQEENNKRKLKGCDLCFMLLDPTDNTNQDALKNILESNKEIQYIVYASKIYAVNDGKVELLETSVNREEDWLKTLILNHREAGATTYQKSSTISLTSADKQKITLNTGHHIQLDKEYLSTDGLLSSLKQAFKIEPGAEKIPETSIEKDLREEVIFYANTALSADFQQVCAQLSSREARQIPLLELDTIMRAAATSLAALKKLNPRLSDDKVIAWRAACINYMLQVTHRQQANLMYKPLVKLAAVKENKKALEELNRVASEENQGKIKELELKIKEDEKYAAQWESEVLGALSQEREYDPYNLKQEDYFPLMFEYFSEFRVRRNQADIIRSALSAIIKKDDAELKNIIFQLIMAGGKTSVIISIILEIAAQNGQLPIVLCHPSQYASVLGNLINFQKSRYGKDLCALEYSMQELDDEAILDEIIKKIDHAKAGGNAIIMKSFMPQVIELKYILESLSLTECKIEDTKLDGYIKVLDTIKEKYQKKECEIENTWLKEHKDKDEDRADLYSNIGINSFTSLLNEGDFKSLLAELTNICKSLQIEYLAPKDNKDTNSTQILKLTKEIEKKNNTTKTLTDTEVTNFISQIQYLSGVLARVRKKERNAEMQKIEEANREIWRSVKKLAQINNEFINNGMGVLDECDIILSMLTEVNVPTGKEQPLTPERSKLVQAIYLSLATNDKTKVLLKNNDQSTLRDDYLKMVAPAVAADLFSNESLRLKNDKDGEKYKAVFIRYVTGKIDFNCQKMANDPLYALKNETNEEIKENVEFLRHIKELSVTDGQAADNIALAAHLMKDVLPLALSRSYNRDYGYHDGAEDDGSVIPFLGVGQPATTKFGDVYLTLCYQLQAALNKGITEGGLRLLAKKMLEEARFYAYKENKKPDDTCEGEWFYNHTGYKLTEILATQGALTKACEFINKNDDPRFRLEVEAEISLFHVKYYEGHASSNPINFIEQMHNWMGCTGTPWNSRSYHRKLDQVLKDKGAEGKVLNEMLKRANSKWYEGYGALRTIKADQASIGSDKLQAILNQITNHPKHDQLRCFIDAGGFLKDTKNEQVAKEILNTFDKIKEKNADNESSINAVVYLHRYEDGSESFILLQRLSEGTYKSIKLKNTSKEEIGQYEADLNKVFVYYDELRTTGTDIALAPGTIGLETIDPRMPVRTLLQATLRERGYFDKKQDCEFLITEEAQKDMPNNGKTLQDVVDALIDNQAIAASDQIFSHYLAQITNTVRNCVKNLMLGAGEKDQDKLTKLTLNYRDLFITSFKDEPYKQFGQIAGPEDTLKILKQHAITTLGDFFIKTSKIIPLDPDTVEMFTPDDDDNEVNDVLPKELLPNVDEARLKEQVEQFLNDNEIECNSESLKDLLPNIDETFTKEIENVVKLTREILTDVKKDCEDGVLAKKFKCQQGGEIDIKVQIQQEQTIQLNLSEQQEIELRSELKIELNQYNFDPKTKVFEEKPWELVGEVFDWSTYKDKDELLLVQEVCRRPYKNGVITERFAKCFPNNLYMSSNLYKTTANEELPLLHKDMKQASFMLATRDPSDGELKFLLLSKHDVDNGFRDWIHAKQPKDAWLMDLSGNEEVTNRKHPITELKKSPSDKESIETALWHANFFNGNAAYLEADENERLSQRIMVDDKKQVISDYVLLRSNYIKQLRRVARTSKLITPSNNLFTNKVTFSVREKMIAADYEKVQQYSKEKVGALKDEQAEIEVLKTEQFKWLQNDEAINILANKLLNTNTLDKYLRFFEPGQIDRFNEKNLNALTAELLNTLSEEQKEALTNKALKNKLSTEAAMEGVFYNNTPK